MLLGATGIGPDGSTASCRESFISKNRLAVPAISNKVANAMLAWPRRLVNSVRSMRPEVMSKVQARNIAIGKPTTNTLTASVATHCGRNNCSTRQ
jgi:hypothetical protein